VGKQTRWFNRSTGWRDWDWQLALVNPRDGGEELAL
jgi:hypothetical protein